MSYDNGSSLKEPCFDVSRVRSDSKGLTTSSTTISSFQKKIQSSLERFAPAMSCFAMSVEEIESSEG